MAQRRPTIKQILAHNWINENSKPHESQEWIRKTRSNLTDSLLRQQPKFMVAKARSCGREQELQLIKEQLKLDHKTLIFAAGAGEINLVQSPEDTLAMLLIEFNGELTGLQQQFPVNCRATLIEGKACVDIICTWPQCQ